MPLIPDNIEESIYTPPICLYDMHLCYEYSGLTFRELLGIDIYEYRIILINAITQEALKTEEGKDMLQTYVRISKHNKDIDLEGLSTLFG